MVLSWLPKLFLGSALLAGTGIGLGSAIFTSEESESVGLTAKRKSQTIQEETKILNEKEAELDLESQEDDASSARDVESKDLTETRGRESSDNSEQYEEKSTPPNLSQESPEEKSGCIIHQLQSSSRRAWKFLKIGTWENFLKEKKEKREAFNEQEIKQECEKAQGKDILVTNKAKNWWSSMQWNFFKEDQNNAQFRSYLNEKNN